jgi:hypothetical protein
MGCDGDGLAFTGTAIGRVRAAATAAVRTFNHCKQVGVNAPKHSRTAWLSPTLLLAYELSGLDDLDVTASSVSVNRGPH